MKRLELDITHDAVAIVEFSTMPAGFIATDAATKASEIALLFSGTAHPGKFLLAFEGGVSETELALQAAKQAGRTALIDSVHLPFPHPHLRARQTPTLDTPELALLAVETLTVPSLLGALDQTLKSTLVTLRLMQLADHLGGKSLAVLEGDLPDIESAYGYLNAGISSLLLSDLQLIRRPTRQFTESFLNSLR
ncbi:MAG: BMC domain-containing protein [Bradymonadia bacterium]